MRFTIDKTILEQALNYLATKPYHEVVQLITNIQQDAREVQESPPTTANT